MRWEDQEKKKEKMKYEISGEGRKWMHQETIEKFLVFSWEKIHLHSKSKGYTSAVKFFRFKIVTINISSFLELEKLLNFGNLSLDLFFRISYWA